MNSMRYVTTSLTVILLVAGLSGSDARAWDKNEHRMLADSVYHSVMRECARSLDDTAYLIGDAGGGLVLPHKAWDQHTFGELCASSAADDLAKNRFHDLGKTIMEQLESLSAEQIETQLRAAGFTHTPGQELETRPLSADNVIQSYLLHHLYAMQLVATALQPDQDDRRLVLEALAFEAVAQGYLADAFSAGHILVHRADPLAFLHRRNIIEAHNRNRTRGAYVVNSQGDAWQTFGDEVMHWYGPSYIKVLQACRNSLMELVAVVYASGDYAQPDLPETWPSWAKTRITSGPTEAQWQKPSDGVDYYLTNSVPTLRLLPMSVTATWSYRTDDKDEHDIRRHHHYPQLRDEGLHDSSLSPKEIKELYWRSSMPPWMTPKPFRSNSANDPDWLVRHDRDWASVRWTQTRSIPPSYKGVLLHIGGQLTHRGGRGLIGGLVGVGYCRWDDLVLLNNLSIDMIVTTAAADHDRPLMVSSVGFGVPIKQGLLYAVRFECGLAADLESDYDKYGFMCAVGVDSPVLPLGFTEAGVTARLKYQRFRLHPTLHGPSLQLILH